MQHSDTELYPAISIDHLKSWWSAHSRTHHPLSIKYLSECESTNSQLYRSPSHANTLLVTEVQTQGRGQFEREWQTRSGDLIFSLGLRLPADKVPALSIRVGLAMAQVFNHFGYQAQLKWPNDVILNKGKLAGILVQISPISNNANWVVIGVGINIASRKDIPLSKNNMAAFAPMGLAQVDLHWCSPKSGEREALLMQLVDTILLHVDSDDSLTPENMSQEWNAFDVWRGQDILWIDPFGQKHPGIGQGIDSDGTYQMLSPRGQVAIYSGQIRSAVEFTPSRIRSSSEP